MKIQKYADAGNLKQKPKVVETLIRSDSICGKKMSLMFHTCDLYSELEKSKEQENKLFFFLCSSASKWKETEGIVAHMFLFPCSHSPLYVVVHSPSFHRAKSIRTSPK